MVTFSYSNGRSIKKMYIQDGSILVEYMDGKTDILGKAQVINKSETYIQGQSVPPGHFSVYSIVRDGSNLVAICNNNKRFVVDLTDANQAQNINQIQASLADLQPKNIRVTSSADQAIPAGVLTTLDYDATQYTTAGNDFTVSTDGRITVRNAGVYSITCGTSIEAQVGALDRYNLVLTANGDVVAATGSFADLAVGEVLPMSVATQLSLSADDIVDARVQLEQVVNGVGNGIARNGRLLFGADATQVNHLAISKVG